MATTATRSRTGNPIPYPSNVPPYVTSLSTITTATAHGLQPGNCVTLSGMTDTTFNGTWTVLTVPNTTTFTFNQIGPDVTSGADVGGSTTQSPTYGVTNEFYNSAVAASSTDVGPMQMKKGDKALFSISGTWVGTFQIQVATTNTSGAYSPTIFNGSTDITTNAAGMIEAPVDQLVKIRCTAYTSGSAAVELQKQ